MTCEDCTKAAEGPHHGFRSTCRTCWARAVASSQAFKDARDASADDPERPAKRDAYRRRLFALSLTHQEVLAAAEADALHRNMELPIGGPDAAD